jgi:hypothetical protein
MTFKPQEMQQSTQLNVENKHKLNLDTLNILIMPKKKTFCVNLFTPIKFNPPPSMTQIEKRISLFGKQQSNANIVSKSKSKLSLNSQSKFLNRTNPLNTNNKKSNSIPLTNEAIVQHYLAQAFHSQFVNKTPNYKRNSRYLKTHLYQISQNHQNKSGFLQLPLIY